MGDAEAGKPGGDTAAGDGDRGHRQGGVAPDRPGGQRQGGGPAGDGDGLGGWSVFHHLFLPLLWFENIHRLHWQNAFHKNHFFTQKFLIILKRCIVGIYYSTFRYRYLLGTRSSISPVMSLSRNSFKESAISTISGIFRY